MSRNHPDQAVDASRLLALREQLEARWARDYLHGPDPAAPFDFLSGHWQMTRRAFDLQGNVTAESAGRLHAGYLLDGRVLQEEYHSYLPDGRIFRGGVGLHTYIPDNPGSGRWLTASVDAAIGVNTATVLPDGNTFYYENTFEIQGATVHLRGRWFDIQTDAVSWVGAGSIDGSTWFKTYEVESRRISAAAFHVPP